MFDTPILYLVFNRPDETSKSFEVIRKLKPKKLFVAADGPRNGNRSDLLNCEKVKSIILDNIDWDCELKTLVRADNLGCGKAVQGALDWFFDDVEMGIIIEDDIIPDASFFEYAAILLHQFKGNHQIFSVNGCSLAYENHRNNYGLTAYFNMWGWATWRRTNDLVHKTWKSYDGIEDFKKGSKLLKSLRLPTILPHTEWINKWQDLFDATKNGKIDTWDYQWVYTCLKNQHYCIRPNLNMINNIGFNENSTHTNKAPHIRLSNLKVHTLTIANSTINGRMKMDPQYEIINVAAYWNGVVISYHNSFVKAKRYLLKMFK